VFRYCLLGRVHRSLDGYTDHYADRWRYLCHNQTAPHLCPNCGKYVDVYKDKFCSYQCSNHGHKTPTKTGPKVDLQAKHAQLVATLAKLRPDFEVAEWGYPRSLFLHTTCGTTFQADNYGMIGRTAAEQFRVKCQCQYQRTMQVTLASLQQLHAQHQTPWLPVTYVAGAVTATFEHTSCGHQCELPVKYATLLTKCTVCYPNPTTRAVNHDQYVAKLAKHKPEFVVIGKYVDSRTPLRYQHRECGELFTTDPNWLQKPEFRCPACAPKFRASIYEVGRDGSDFRLRGKEDVGLDWLLVNTKIRASQICCDGNGDTPVIKYKSPHDFMVHKYRPDFWIPRHNLLVEVKDVQHLGIGQLTFFHKRAYTLWKNNCAKAKACRQQGYRFRMLVFDKANRRVKLPPNWYNWSWSAMRAWYRRSKL